MGKYVLANLLILLLNLGAALTILACNCPIPTPPKVKPPYPPKVKPPTVPKPPVVKPPSPPKVKPTPPTVPKPPVVKPPKPPVVKPPSPPTVKPTPPTVPKPPVVKPPSPKPTPPTVPEPPVVKPPVEPTPPAVPKPSPAPPTEQTCSIDILKLSACVDLLGGLVNIGIGSGAKETCCPVLQGLVDLDAAICLCTTIKAKLLNINIVIPIALQVLIDCGKTPPEGFKCPT